MADSYEERRLPVAHDQAQEEAPAAPAIEGLGTASRHVLKRGTVLIERYEITKVLGLGGMSTVYAARDMRFATTFTPSPAKERADPTPRRIARQHLLPNFVPDATRLATRAPPAI